jgi:hypothetical protein
LSSLASIASSNRKALKTCAPRTQYKDSKQSEFSSKKVDRIFPSIGANRHYKVLHDESERSTVINLSCIYTHQTNTSIYIFLEKEQILVYTFSYGYLTKRKHIT